MRVSTFVDGWFCAAHRDPLSGKLHGHTWKVRAYFDATDWRDARSLQETLKGNLQAFDHTELPALFTTAEGLAAKLLDMLAHLPCVRVDVWREPEGMGASAVA